MTRRSSPRRARATRRAARRHARRMGRRRRPLGLRLRLADLAARVRVRRGPAGHRARLAPRAGDALARQPRHARVPGPRVRAGRRRLVPRPGLPHRARARVDAELERLWAREMPTGVYDPKWLPAARRRARSAAWPSRSSRRSPSHTGRSPTTRWSRSCARANGRYGSTLAYLVETARVAARLRHPRPRDRAPGRAGAPPRADR